LSLSSLLLLKYQQTAPPVENRRGFFFVEYHDGEDTSGKSA